MNPERFPGEPLHERLTHAERIEVQGWWIRTYHAKKFREAWSEKFGTVPAEIPMPGRHADRRKEYAVLRAANESRRATAHGDHARQMSR